MAVSKFHTIVVSACVLQAACVLTQSVLAGSFLSGADPAVSAHEAVGWLTFGMAVLQLGLLLSAAGSRYGIWMRVSSTAIAVAEVLQLGTGYGRFLRVHIPLAVLIVGALVWQITWILKGQPASERLADEHF